MRKNGRFGTKSAQKAKREAQAVKKRAVPAYWRKNVIQQANRRAKAHMDARRAEKEAESNRKAVGQVLSWCMVIAMHDLYGFGKKRFEAFGAALSAQADEYTKRVREKGLPAAQSWLEEQTADVVPPEYHIPLIKAAKTERERALRREQCEAGNMALRMMAKTARELWGIGPERAKAILAETDKNYRQFLDWAKDGDAYGYELLRRKAEEITGEKVAVAQAPGEKPVFSAAFY